MKGMPAAANCGRMLDHGLAAVGRDDPELDPARPASATLVEVRVLHRTRMKRRDLIVVEVGGDEGLGRKGVGDDPDVPRVQAERLKARAVGLEVVAGRRHRHPASPSRCRL